MGRYTAIAAVVVAVAGGFAGFRWLRAPSAPVLTTTAVTRGPLRMTVETTGSVTPLVRVNVGCEVSGTIGELHADYNSQVSKGQVLARLRPELFEADLAQAEANLLAARAQLRESEVDARSAQRQLDRLTRLRDERGAAADEEVQTAAERRDAADARVAAAQAAVRQAEAVRDLQKTRLDRSVIYAPIDGIVLAREVDVGQTVAATLTTPVLFVLAPDLDAMQVHASVSESDIGRVRAGQTAEFTVDAYPDRAFAGTVSQVRNNPTTIRDVVTYTVVIDVDNRAQLLKPGMTANVTIEVARRADAIKVANSALRFRPPIAGDELVAVTTGLTWPQVRDDPPAGAPAPDAAGSSAVDAPGPPIRADGVVWTFERGRWSPIPVVLGITDNRETEILAGIEPGRECVTGVKAPAGGFSLKEAIKLASPENRKL